MSYTHNDCFSEQLSVEFAEQVVMSITVEMKNIYKGNIILIIYFWCIIAIRVLSKSLIFGGGGGSCLRQGSYRGWVQ